jgi:hypothetical protein
MNFGIHELLSDAASPGARAASCVALAARSFTAQGIASAGSKRTTVRALPVLKAERDPARAARTLVFRRELYTPARREESYLGGIAILVYLGAHHRH